MRRMLIAAALAAGLAGPGAGAGDAAGGGRQHAQQPRSGQDHHRRRVHLRAPRLQRPHPHRPRPHDQARPGRELDRLRRPQGVDLQAARGRQVPQRQGARRRRRGRHHAAHPRSGHRLAGARQHRHGREGRGGRSAHRALHAQHPLRRLPGHLRRAPAAHPGQGRDRQHLDEADRHRAVPLQVVVARRPHGAGEEPRLLREGPAQARRRHHAHHPGDGGARGGDRVRAPSISSGTCPTRPSTSSRTIPTCAPTAPRPPPGTASSSTTSARPSTTCACARRWPPPSTRRRWWSWRCSARARRRTARSRRATPISTRSWASRSPTSPRPRSCWPRPACPTASR